MLAHFTGQAIRGELVKLMQLLLEKFISLIQELGSPHPISYGSFMERVFR